MKRLSLLLVYTLLSSGAVLSQQLDTVSVTAKKRTFQRTPEGLVVNVPASLLSKGSSVLSLLERSPGVLIDRQRGNITLNGKSEVSVLLNGKPMSLSPDQVVELLASMNGNDVTSIELLSTPGARYDAQGAGGVINIVTARSKKVGTSGVLSITAGQGWGEKLSGTGSISHVAGPLELHASISGGRDRSYSEMDITSMQNMPTFGGRLSVEAVDTTRALRTNHQLTLASDVHLSPRTTIGYSLTATNTLNKSIDNNQTDYITPVSIVPNTIHIEATSRWNNFLHAMYIQKEGRNNTNWTADVNYLRFSNDNPSTIRVNKISDDSAVSNTLIEVGIIKSDLKKKVNNKLSVESGVKFTLTKTTSNSAFANLSNSSALREYIAAVYGSLNYSPDSLTSLILGARYEYWHPGLRESSAALFPSLLLTRKLNRRNELQLSFSSRISRPNYTDLASYVRYSDPTAIYTGNTLLQPTLDYTATLGWRYRRSYFSLAFTNEKSPIARYQITENADRTILIISPQNLRYQKSMILQTIIPITVNNWWTMNYHLMAAVKSFALAHTKMPASKTYVTYSLNINQSFNLPRSFSAEVSGWYNARSYNGSVLLRGMGAVNVGLKKQFRKNRGSLQLAVEDVLTSMKINNQYGTFATEAFDVKNIVSIDLESAHTPVFKLTYTISLGKGSFKSRQQKLPDTERISGD